ncbi:protein-disulfide reductase DsbD [bacterium]|nr:protein-disulfide reductase DsbD [bacterium]MBU1990411.1 protein-disulfide reductase DsbD [bacterium]
MKKLFLFLLASLVVLAAPPKFLMPEEAFIPHAKLNENMQIQASVEIAKDIYLYADKLKMEIKKGDGIHISEIISPSRVAHEGDMAYLETPHFVVNLQKESRVQGMKSIEFELFYQGCSEQGLCYEPLSKVFTFEIDSSKLSVLSAVKEPAVAKIPLKTSQQSVDTGEVSQTDAISDVLKNSSVWVILLTFFGFGLLLSLTPCVFPMIPIISGVIVSQCKDQGVCRAFSMSLVYVLAMSVAYTIAGVLAGMFGANLQAALQNPWVIVSFAGVFVALAMSMFGFYELKIPDSIVAKVSSTGEKKGGMAGVAVMGFLSALIVGPCVAAPLAGALVYIGQTGDAFLGGAALFAMSLGMGLPLIFIGTSAGKFMPKPGEWMTLVNAFFGVSMIVIAIWMLERILDNTVTMMLYAVTGISFAFYLGLFDTEKQQHHIKKSIAMLIFLYSLAVFIGVLGGSSSMSKPLEVFKGGTLSQTAVQKQLNTTFVTVTSIEELDIELAKYKGKKILLDFSAKWCTACKELEEVTFADENVKAKMAEFVLIKADVTDNGENEKALSKKYGVFGPPAILFIDETGEVMQAKTIIGFIPPDEFLTHLNKI